MKNLKYIHVGIAAILFLAMSCEDNQTAAPDTTNKNTAALTANFLLINASPDAPSLDFYVNNVLTGTSAASASGQTKYTNVSMTTNNTAANTNLRAKATSGSIGGILGSSDLIFRAGNNNTNNFQAADGGSYTLIVVDSLNRPVPIRTLNEKSFGDISYYSSVSTFVSDTTINLNLASNNSTVIANLIKKHNNNLLPSTFVPIGVVPLGSSDVGGLRFLLLTDELPLPSTTRLPIPTAGKFAARFVNASPDAGTAACKVNAVTVGGSTTFPMLTSNFNPSVGSRSATIAFTNNVTTSGVAYDIIVTVGTSTVTLTAQTFTDGGVYTIVLAGSKAKGTLKVALVQNK